MSEETCGVYVKNQKESQQPQQTYSGYPDPRTKLCNFCNPMGYCTLVLMTGKECAAENCIFQKILHKSEHRCDEDCQLFRWHKCETKDPAGYCDQPERYDNALNEFNDPPEEFEDGKENR